LNNDNDSAAVFYETVLEGLKSRNTTALKTMLSSANELDLLYVIQEMSAENQVIIYRLLSKDIALSIFEQLDVSSQEKLIHSFTEEAAVDEGFEFEETGEPKFVLHNAGLHARGLREGVEFERGGGVARGRFFAVDVFPSGNRGANRIGAERRALRVEINLIRGVFEERREVGREFFDTTALGELRKFDGVASDENRIGHDELGRRDFEAALLHDGDKRTEQMLVGAHASGDAVHDDANFVDGHKRWGLRVKLWCVAVVRHRVGEAYRQLRPWGACRRVPGASARHRPRGRSNK